MSPEVSWKLTTARGADAGSGINRLSPPPSASPLSSLTIQIPVLLALGTIWWGGSCPSTTASSLLPGLLPLPDLVLICSSGEFGRSTPEDPRLVSLIRGWCQFA